MTRSIVALILIAVIVGCGETERGAPEQARTLRLLFQSGPDSLDPGTAKTARASFLLRQFLGATLCERAEDGELVPLAAAELPERTPDGWRLRLRSEAAWPDGQALRPEDFCRAFDLVKEGRAGGHLAAGWAGLEGYVVESPRVFRILTKGAGLARREQIATELTALPPGWEPGDEVHEGLGPYRLLERDRGHLVLERRDDWWGDDVKELAGRFRTGRLEWRFEPDQVKTRALLEAGEVDLAAIDPDQVDDLDIREFATLSFDSGAFSFVGFNCKRGPAARWQLRRVLADGLPREIAERRPLELEAAAVLDPSVSFQTLSSVEMRRALNAAGWRDRDGDGRREGPAGETELRLLRATGRIPWCDAFLVHWRERLAQCGVKLEVESLPVPELLQRLKAGDFDLFVLVWRGASRFDSLRDLLHSSQTVDTGRNWTGLEDEDLDARIEAMESASSEQDFASSRRALATRLRDEAPLALLFRHRLTLVLRRTALEIRPGEFGPHWPSIEAR